MRGLLLSLALFGGARAWGATADGTLITNVACATYSIYSKAGYNVSYCATAGVLVRNPALVVGKVANPTTQSSGGTITYTIWVTSIECTVSAFNVQVVDRLPDNVAWSDNWTSWGGLSAGSWTAYNSSDNVTYAAGQPVVGQGVPLYLRWNLTMLGPCASAFVQFTATVL